MWHWGSGERADWLCALSFTPTDPEMPDLGFALSQNVCCHPGDTYLIVSGMGPLSPCSRKFGKV